MVPAAATDAEVAQAEPVESCSTTPSPQSLPMRLSYHICLDQHVYMLRLHLCMLGKPLLGGWITLCLMTLLYSNSDASFESFLFWAFSSFLLSFFLANKDAQEHVSLHTCFCWHLGCVQIFRDEVRGKCPPVYEEVFSETKASVFLSLLRLVFFLSWCLNSGLQLNTCLIELKIELRFAARQKVLGMHDTMIGMVYLLMAYNSGMCCTIMSVLIRKYYVNDGVLNCINGLYVHSNIFWALYLIGRTENGLPWCYGSA